ncbi:MAG: ABC transporter permease [Acidiferrobacteraceae bacterium]
MATERPHHKRAPVVRPESLYTLQDASNIGQVVRPLSVWERITNITLIRRVFILLLLAALWQVYGDHVGNSLIFPTFTRVLAATWDASVHGHLLLRCWNSVRTLVIGYLIGVFFATVFTIIAITTRLGSDLLETLTAMFNPLPAIALLPLAMLWFGLGEKSILFVLVQGAMWPITLNTHAGFKSVSDSLRMAGRNCGLRGVRYVVGILIPAAFPSILTGLKIGWAFAWRTLIASELVFGVSSSSGGLGWFIFENRNELAIPYVFAGLLAVIVIGLLVESVVFRTIELHTVRKWGMQR